MFSRKADASMAPSGRGFPEAASKLPVFRDQRAALTPVCEISQPIEGQGVFQRRRQRRHPEFALPLLLDSAMVICNRPSSTFSLAQAFTPGLDEATRCAAPFQGASRTSERKPPKGGRE
jgi:hypothetical protein